MAAVGQRYYTPNPFEIDANGVPLANAQLFFYETGTSTPLDTYSDVSLSTPNPNPVRADANGRFGNIWLTPSTAYKVELWTQPTDDNPTGTQVWSMDPVGPASGGVPTNTAGIIGEVRDFAGPSSSVPSQWYLCYGQAISRTTYASLFAVIGTTYGSGDGTTTFNLPDCRGRVGVGKDDMGGSAANRITSGVSGINGATLGAAGGSQNPDAGTLSANSVSVVTDPGHTHTLPAVQPTSTPGVGIAGVGTGYSFPTGNTGSSTTGITVATTTTVTSTATGTAGNVQPSIIFNKIIYGGA